MPATASSSTSVCTPCGFCRVPTPPALLDHVDVGDASVAVCAECLRRTEAAEWLVWELGGEVPANDLAEERPLPDRA